MNVFCNLHCRLDGCRAAMTEGRQRNLVKTTSGLPRDVPPVPRNSQSLHWEWPCQSAHSVLHMFTSARPVAVGGRQARRMLDNLQKSCFALAFFYKPCEY